MEKLTVIDLFAGIGGFSLGLDRLEELGNAVVPQIPEIIGRAILEMRDAA